MGGEGDLPRSVAAADDDVFEVFLGALLEGLEVEGIPAAHHLSADAAPVVAIARPFALRHDVGVALRWVVRHVGIW